MNLANKISIARIMLIPFFIVSVAYSKMDIALVIFMLAIISDGLDGFVARALKQKTELGTVLDPIADKLLLITAYVCLSFMNNVPAQLKMPPYVPIVIISRDVILVIGAVLIHLIAGNLKVAPSPIGKITTFFQMLTIVAILVKFKYAAIVWNTTIILTVASGVDYVARGIKLLNENNFIKR